MAIEIRKLTPHIGAEIHGIDLSRPLDDAGFAAVHGALMDHSVIFFRDQDITVDQQKEFGRRFGELHIHPAAPGALAGHPEILVIHADEKSKRVAGEEWHSDVSCDPEPPMGSVLHITELPPVGGDTLFASMYAAYETLSDEMQRFLCGLTAVHDGEHVYRGRYNYDDRGKSFPRAEHPVIRTHPVTGRRALFVNRGFTTRIVELKRAESDAVLQMLFRHVETPELHCRFRWAPRSIAFWDNRCVQHHAMWDYYPQRRHGNRVTIRGDKPFFRP
jgi:alpha-ketoglutarate-dependent taurine dioxygenase